jgi:uncharacterized protein
MTDKQPLYDQISAYLRDKGIRRAAVFGSFARNEETPDSDIDLLIDAAPNMTLFDWVRMEEELGRLTHRKIDMVDYRAVKPRLCKSIFQTTVSLL